MSKPTEQAPKGTLTTDPEITALTRTARLLSELEPAARLRVLGWLNMKFDPPTPNAPSED